MINKSNIEEKLFDYFEGVMTSSEKNEVDQFIDSNPEFKTDFDAWEKSFLPQENFTYDRVNELLVDEKTGKSAFFGKWKAGLLMLLVGTGLSFGLFQKISGDQNNVIVDAEVKKINDSKMASTSNPDVENGAKSNQLSDDLIVSDNTLALKTSSNKSIRNIDISNGANKISTVPSIPHANNGNVSQTGGAVNVNTAANRVSNQASSGSQNTLNTGSYLPSNNQGNSNLEKLLVDNIKYSNIEVGFETSSVEALLSTPRIKKGRSKFEKYDKNVLKFQNEKDPFFALPNGVALSMNPAFTGNGKGLRVNYNYNFEWPELNENYNTHMLSIDTYVKALKGGVGVVLYSDVLGHNKFSTSGAEVIYSPKFKLFGKTTIEPALKYGHYSKNVAWDQVKTNQLVDARTGILNLEVDESEEVRSVSSDSYSNLGFGLLLNTSKLFVGLSYDRLLNATYNFGGISEKIDVAGKLTAQVGGSVIPVKDLDYLILSPSLHFIKVGGFDKVWLSNIVSVNRLFVGTSYSFNNEYLFSLGYDNETLRVSYSFGQTKSMLDQSAKNLSLHQVGLVFNFIPRRR
jgi:type IX secretion system PorP/SprF family membrane protein